MSKIVYNIGIVVILAIPVLIKIDVLLYGEKTECRAIEVVKVEGRSRFFGDSFYTLFEYKTTDGTIKFYGPENMIYEIGKTFPLKFKKNKPTRKVVLNLKHLYLKNSSIIPLILLLLWISYYSAVGKRPSLRSFYARLKKSKGDNKRPQNLPERKE